MLKIFKKLVIIGFLILTISACQENKNITNREFLMMLASEAGYEKGSDNYLTSLKAWGISKNEDLNEKLSYQQAGIYLCRLLRLNKADLETAKRNGLLPKKATKEINQQIAKEWLLAAVKRLDMMSEKELKIFNKKLTTKEQALKNDIYYENNAFYLLNSKGQAQKINATSILKNAYFKTNEKIKIDPHRIFFFGQKLEETGYNKPRFAPLKNEYLVKGYRVTYRFLPSGLEIHLAKNKKLYTFFVDLRLNDISPQFIWHFANGHLQQVKMTLAYDFKQEIGISKAREINKNVSLKTIDKQSFLKLLAFNEPKHEITIIPLCRFKLPFKQLPFVDFDLELALHLYAGGKAKLVFTNQQIIGFEIYKGNFRLLNKAHNNLYPSFLVSSKASLALKANFSFLKEKIANIYLLSGISASLNPQIHFFDAKENLTYRFNNSYENFEEKFSNLNNVEVCSDLALEHFFKVGVNDEETLLSRLSFQRELPIFHNKILLNGGNYLQNGLFVKACNFTKTSKINNLTTINNSEQINLAKYNIFLKQGEKVEIPIISLPSGYKISDCVFVSLDEKIVKIKGKKVIGIKSGVTQIKIMTADKKHEVYCHLLVSDAS